MAHLRPIDKEFEEADDTGVLVLSSRNLRNFPVVPGELCDFNDLLEADFSSNRFDHIPQEVCDFRALVRLNFYSNSLRTVPDDLRYLENLHDLNLSRNLLATIPLGLCHMNLHSLDLSNNRLVSLPLQLGSLAKLRYLNLSCNHLPDLPLSLVELITLQHLDLHRNQLKELPSDIHLLALRYLDISCNHITALPTTLRHIADSLKIFKMADNPIESPPTHVCVRGLQHIVKWMEGLEKHGSDPHLLLSSSAMSSREASLARRTKSKRNSITLTSRSFIDNSQGENGPLNLMDEVAHQLVNSSSSLEPAQPKNDGEITPTLTSTPLHWSVAQFRNTPGSAMSDQSKEEYREAAHRLYMQQERQKSRNNRRKRSSSPIQATAKAAVALARQQSGSTEFNTLPRRSSKEDMTVIASLSAGGTKSVGGSPRTRPGRSLPGERYPRPGSWNSHVKVTSSPILPSKYALPSNEKSTSEDESSSRGGDSEDEVRQKSAPQATRPEPVTTRPDPVQMRRNVSAGEVRTRPQVEETHKKPPPLESPVTASASSPSRAPLQAPHQANAHPESTLHAELSPGPRSDSVTPTNELADEESLTPKSREAGKNPEQTLVAASQKLLKEAAARERVAVRGDGGQEGGKPATNGEVEKRVARGDGKMWRQSLPEQDMVIEVLSTSPKAKARRPLLSDSDADDRGKKDATWPRGVPPRKKKEKDVFRFLKDHDANYTVRRQEFQMSRIIEKCRTVKEQIENQLGLELADDIGEWVTDGVVPCQLVNKLHPQLMGSFHTPPPGQALSRARKTVNIANFIAACRQLQVPEEELCSAGDLIELKDPVRVVTCLQRVLESADIRVGSP